MGFSHKQKIGYGVFLFLTMVLAGLHVAVAFYGWRFAADWVNDNPSWDHINRTTFSTRHLYQKQQKHESYFLWATAGLTIIIGLILLIAICTQCIAPRVKHVLATFLLMLGFGIGVVLALRAHNNSNLKNQYHSPSIYDRYEDFRTYYILVYIDVIACIVFEILFLIILFFGTLNEIIYSEIVNPVVVEVPPLSNRNF